MKYYHATYNSHLKSIMKSGLGAKQKKNFDYSLDNVVYLSTDSDIAESFVEDGVVEETPEEVIDSGIVILCIDEDDLDTDLLFVDKNVIIDDEDDEISFEYHGVISPDKLKIYKQSKPGELI